MQFDDNSAENSFLPLEELKAATIVHGVLIKEVNFRTGANGRISDLSQAGPYNALTLRGTIYYGTEARAAQIRFTPDPEQIPTPIYDAAAKKIILYLPESHLQTIAELMRTSKHILCIYWESSAADTSQAEIYTYDTLP